VPVNSTRENDFARLGAFVFQTRCAAGSTAERLAQQCAVPTATVESLEAGTVMDLPESLISGLEASLGWPAGTIARILANAKFYPPSGVYIV
jgi:hypothetical protein